MVDPVVVAGAASIVVGAASIVVGAASIVVAQEVEDEEVVVALLKSHFVQVDLTVAAVVTSAVVAVAVPVVISVVAVEEAISVEVVVVDEVVAILDHQSIRKYHCVSNFFFF